MLELLRMCGYEEGEMERELPRVREVFTRLDIGDDDIEQARDRLFTYYDMELTGVRKITGLFLKELVNMNLARDEGRTKIIHSCMAPGIEILGSAIMSHSRDVGLVNPNFIFMVVMGCVFGKFVHILEAAERQWLRSGITAHCGMVKTRLGILALDMIPRPDMTVTTGFTCETSPKTNELIEAFYGIPAYYIDTCQDRDHREYPDASRTIDLAAKSMRKFSRLIQIETGFEITDDMLWEALRAREPFGRAMGRLLKLIRNSDPMPIGSTHLNILSVLGSIPFRPTDLTSAVSALDILYNELEARVRKGIGITAKGAPRVLAILPNHQSDPRLEFLANQMGIAIIASDFEFSTRGRPASNGGAARDPYEVIMDHLHGSLAQSLGGRIPVILEACRRLRIDGALDHYHVGCRDVAGDALAIKDALVKELGIPVLMFEWENFDPRVYNQEEYKLKLEIFRSMMEGD